MYINLLFQHLQETGTIIMKPNFYIKKWNHREIKGFAQVHAVSMF